jgi:heme oxygenase
MRVRARLRDVTADIHEALHRAAPFARIADGHIDRAGYAALLCFLYRYHGAMEGNCATGAARLNLPQLATSHRHRLAALRADLAALAMKAPPVAPWPSGQGDFAVGSLYTVLGSMLGGRVIHRQLDALLQDEKGRSFFHGRAEDGAHWRRFCERLETADLDVAHLEAGAIFAFARFQDMLAEENATT